MCAQLMASTDHGVSHEEAGDVRILSLLPLHMLDHISRVGVEGLHMYTVTFTSSVANWGKKIFQLQHARTYVSKLSNKGGQLLYSVYHCFTDGRKGAGN